MSVCFYFFCYFGNFLFSSNFLYFFVSSFFYALFSSFSQTPYIFSYVWDGLRDGFRILIITLNIFWMQLWIHHRLKGGKTIYEKMHTIIVLFYFNSIRFLYEKCPHIAWDDFLPYSDNSSPIPQSPQFYPHPTTFNEIKTSISIFFSYFPSGRFLHHENNFFFVIVVFISLNWRNEEKKIKGKKREIHFVLVLYYLYFIWRIFLCFFYFSFSIVLFYIFEKWFSFFFNCENFLYFLAMNWGVS